MDGPSLLRRLLQRLGLRDTPRPLPEPDEGPDRVVDVGRNDAVNWRGDLAVWLAPDEVLVLSDWCERMEREGEYEGLVVDEGERQALFSLNYSLTHACDDVFDPNWAELVAAARKRLRPTED